MSGSKTISYCPECGGFGSVPSLSSGPEEPLWVRCPECDGTGDHYCECRIDPDCRAHGSDEVWERLPRRAS